MTKSNERPSVETTPRKRKKKEVFVDPDPTIFFEQPKEGRPLRKLSREGAAEKARQIAEDIRRAAGEKITTPEPGEQSNDFLPQEIFEPAVDPNPTKVVTKQEMSASVIRGAVQSVGENFMAEFENLKDEKIEDVLKEEKKSWWSKITERFAPKKETSQHELAVKEFVEFLKKRGGPITAWAKGNHTVGEYMEKHY